MAADLGPYKWVQDRVDAAAGEPKMIAEALKLFGTHEAPGAADNPVILDWAKEIGLGQSYKHDAEPWCGLTMALVAHRAGYQFPALPLWAANWAKFGQPSPKPAFGDILVFARYDNRGRYIGGHVALYVAEDIVAFHCLGGNQSDQVDIARVDRNRIRTVRRPPYKEAPKNIEQIVASIAGALSTNEA